MKGVRNEPYIAVPGGKVVLNSSRIWPIAVFTTSSCIGEEEVSLVCAEVIVGETKVNIVIKKILFS